jgi:hypothetical protein
MLLRYRRSAARLVWNPFLRSCSTDFALNQHGVFHVKHAVFHFTLGTT